MTSSGAVASGVGRRDGRGRKHGRRVLRISLSLSAALMVAVPLGLLAGAGASSAATPVAMTCGSTGGAPLAAGTYSSVTVTGVCTVNSGQVTVTGNVTVTAGAALISAFAKDQGNAGTTSGLTVDGSVTVAAGGTAVLGCEPTAFPCADDAGIPPTLSSADAVGGSVTATNPLGVLVHDTTIAGDATQSGGGGGVTCTPSGVFASLLGSPVYSDYEDNTIAGNLRVTGLKTCWFGALRDTIGGSATFSGNTFADPDAMETLTNTIAGNLICSENVPVVHYGDSSGSANVVAGYATGECAFGVTQHSPPPAGPEKPIAVPATTPRGYWLGAKDGGVFSFGVPFLGAGAGTGQTLSVPVAGIAAVPGGSGYNLASASGPAYAHGAQAASCTGVPGPLNQPVVGIAQAPGGDGCWLAASDGGIFATGSNAPFYGSAGALHLNQPIVGIAATPGGDGYYLAAADGGVFAFGPGATFRGSMGGQHLNQPIVGIAVDPSTGGYWLIARDGGVFAFGAPFLGSMGGTPLNRPVVGAAAAPTGDGYYLVASDGGIFALGKGTVFQGSTGAIALNQPIVGMTLG
jgi:hypothetical protein